MSVTEYLNLVSRVERLEANLLLLKTLLDDVIKIAAIADEKPNTPTTTNSKTRTVDKHVAFPSVN